MSVFNANTNAIAASITIPVVTLGSKNQPIGVAITPDGRYVYVANNRSNTVSVINVATNKLVVSIPVGSSPLGLAITPDGQYVYVSDMNSKNNSQPSGNGTVSVIKTGTNTLIASITVGIRRLVSP